MLINNFLSYIQQWVRPLYENSFVLKNIDWLIFINILLVLISSTFAQSDNIAYFGLAVILLTVVKILTKPNEKFELKLADKFLLVYFILVVISVAGSTLFYLSLKGFLKTLTYLGFYVSVIHYFKDNVDKIKYVFLTLILCVSYESFIALLQNFGAVEEISGWQDMSHLNPEEVMTRVYGTLKPYNPNLFGGYLLSLIPVFIPFIFQKNKILSTVSMAFAMLSILALVLTGCRGAYIGLFFECIIFVLILYKFLKPALKKIFTAVVGALGVMISLIIISTSALRARIFSIFAMRSDSSNSFRFNVYHSCINMFKDNWLLGIGCGNQNFREIYGLYMKTGFDALSAYNIYLEIAVESGIFALMAFVGFISNIIINSFKRLFLEDNKNKYFIFAGIISIIGILIHGMVDTVFFRPQIQFVFWLMVGMLRAI